MRKLLALLVLGGIAAGCSASKAPVQTTSGPWIVAYYPGWQQSYMPPSAINLNGITHLVYFSLIPSPAGDLSGSANGITDATANQLATLVHAVNKRILICIGGENTGPAFREAIKTANRANFVRNIANWVNSHSYDGVDIDMEPVENADGADYHQFISSLRALLDRTPGRLLTAAVQNNPTPFAAIQAKFDQINIMTYDLAGAYPGWETWYESSMYNGGRTFKSNGQPLPCGDDMVKNWVRAGIPRTKLGIGVHFHGLVWHVANGPNQPLNGVTTEGVTYAQIADTWYQPSRYHWDAGPHGAYLSVDSTNQSGRAFVVYDDERMCKEKVGYIHNLKMGGLIIWDLSGDYRPAQPAAQREPLMAAIRNALKTYYP